MNIDKMYIDNLLKLSKETKVLEQRKQLLKEEHDSIDGKITKHKSIMELNLSTKELSLKNNLVNKVISENIKKGRDLSKDQLYLFSEYKRNLPLVQKVFFSNKTKLNNFGEHSLSMFKKKNIDIKKEFNSKNKELGSGLKKMVLMKQKLEPLEPLDKDLKRLKGILNKEVNKEVLKKGIQNDTILSKIISFLKEYLKTSSTKALNSVIDNLTKVKSNMDNKVVAKRSQSLKI